MDGIAIQATDTATVTNSVGGIVKGDKHAISAYGRHRHRQRRQRSKATGANGVAINATGTATVNNGSILSNGTVSGTIQANGVNGDSDRWDDRQRHRQPLFLSPAAVFGIQAATVNVTSNTGIISGGIAGIAFSR